MHDFLTPLYLSLDITPPHRRHIGHDAYLITDVQHT